jgi:hypothetical protein
MIFVEQSDKRAIRTPDFMRDISPVDHAAAGRISYNHFRLIPRKLQHGPVIMAVAPIIKLELSPNWVVPRDCNFRTDGK